MTPFAKSCAGLGLLVLTACSGPVRQDGAVGHTVTFGGQTIRILVGSSAGGGQDLFARLVAVHIGRHLEGRPRVVVENMPGAGGLVAANHLARRAEPNGLTLGLLNAQAVLSQVLNDGSQFDARDLKVIGAPVAEDCLWVFGRASGITLDVWRAGRPARLGMTNLGSPTASYALLVAAALHLPIRPVVGYGGTADIRAAIASGEVDGVCVTRSSLVGSFLPEADYVVALQAGSHRVVDGVPLASSLVAEGGQPLLDVLSSISDVNRFLTAPPRTPEDVVSALQAGFQATMQDPAYVSSARALYLDGPAQPAEAVSASIHRLVSLPDEVRRRVVEVLKGTGH